MSVQAPASRRELIAQIRRAAVDPDRGGDVAAYKAELFGVQVHPTHAAAAAQLAGYRPRIDVDALACAAPGTFGRAFADFMRRNRLRPIVPSDEVPQALLDRNVLAIRYATTHDMIHVLTGFDTSWPGEVGVWAFIAAQGYARTYSIAAVFALLVAPLRAPLRLGAVLRSWRRGRALGRAAQPLLFVPLEDRFDQPLVEVRRALGISVPAEVDAAG